MRSMYMLAVCVCLSNPVAADTIYRWVGPDGRVNFGSVPPTRIEAIEVPSGPRTQGLGGPLSDFEREALAEIRARDRFDAERRAIEQERRALIQADEARNKAWECARLTREMNRAAFKSSYIGMRRQLGCP